MKMLKNTKVVIIEDVECVSEYWNNELAFQSKKSTDLNLVGKIGTLIFIPQKIKKLKRRV